MTGTNGTGGTPETGTNRNGRDGAEDSMSDGVALLSGNSVCARADNIEGERKLCFFL